MLSVCEKRKRREECQALVMFLLAFFVFFADYKYLFRQFIEHNRFLRQQD